jgi:hypothetical protein
MRIPSKHEGYAADGVRLYPVGSGGGGGGPSSGTSTTIQDVPDWAKPYAKEGLGKAAALTDIEQNPYQTYDGSRQAGFTGLQNQAFQGAQNMGPSAAMGTAANMAGTAGLAALNAGANFNPYQAQNQFGAPGAYDAAQSNNNFSAPDAYGATQFQNQFSSPQSYQTGQFNADQVQGGNYNAPSMNTAQTGFNPQLQNYQMGPAQQVSTQSFNQSGTAQDYMNPYMQNVVDIQKREAQRSADIAGTQRGAQAAQSGAFGGSRQAIMDAEANRNLSQQLGDIQATGSQAAFQNAQQQFNAEQAAGLQAQQSNQQAGITTGGQNLSANLSTQQLGTQTGLQSSLANLSAEQQANVQNQASQLQTQGLNAQQAMQAALSNQQYGLETQKLGEQSRQFGSGQNLTAAQLQAQFGMDTQKAQEAANQFGAGQGMTAAQLQAQFGQSGDQLAEQSRQFGAGQGMTAAQLQAQYGLSGQQLAEQSRQYGAGLGIQGLNAATTAAGQLSNIGQQTFGQQMDANKLQNQYGTQQQAFNQQGMDTQYQDFLNQQRYPYQQLEFMNSMLRGTPMGTVQSMYQPAPSQLSQIAGLGATAYGVSRMAKGGEVQGYASGGIAGLNPMELDAATDDMSDPQMQKSMGLASITDLAKLQIAQKLAQNGQIRQAAQQAQASTQQQPQSTITEEALTSMGVGGLDVPEDTFSAAGGGIVAFAEGGTSLRGMENDLGIPYGTESEFEKKRREAQEAQASMIPGGNAKSDTVLPSSPTTSMAGIGALMNPKSVQDARASAATMDESAAQGDVIAAQQQEQKYIEDQKALGERGTEREAGLREQQDELKGKEDKNFNMAIIEAGLAMMSGNSANAFENIGKGALVGTKAFKDGEEKLQARKDKLDEAIFALEDARFSDKKVDAATQRDLARNVANAKTGVQKVLAKNYRDANVTVPANIAAKTTEIYAAERLAGLNNAAAMSRVVAGRSALEAAGKTALDNFTKENPNATAEEQLAFIAKLSESTYAGASAKQAALNVSITDKVNGEVALEAMKVNNMAEGPKKVAAQAALDVRKAKLRREYEANAGAGGGTGGGSGVNSNTPPLQPGFVPDQ